MGMFDFFKMKKNDIERKPPMSSGDEEWSKKEPVEKDALSQIPTFGTASTVGTASKVPSFDFSSHNGEPPKAPWDDEYYELTMGLYRVWRDKTEKRKKYNYENGIIEEVYEAISFFPEELRRFLEEDKEETEKLIAFYTENEPTEENIGLYEEYAMRHKLYVRVEITDATYNTLCRYISKCYNERPIGNAHTGYLTVYKLSYELYQKMRPEFEREISIITDETIDEGVKRRVMNEARFRMSWYLTPQKSMFMV